MPETSPHPHTSGHIPVSIQPHHEMYWEEYGNPKGEPLLFLHGGPGDVSDVGDSDILKLFDLDHYRVIFYHQRGTGKSRHDDMLAGNTTDHLVEDIEKLRKVRNIDHQKIHIFGESWGTTLGLAYAIKHPESIKSMTLCGVFLGRKKDIDYSYQGNADPAHPMTDFAGKHFPEEWKKFVEFIPPAERGDMMEAYRRRMFPEDIHGPGARALRDKAIERWFCYEDSTDGVGMVEPYDKEKATPVSLLEAHYFGRRCFFPTDNYILENVDKIKDIPMHIVNGKHDRICPPDQAQALYEALDHAQKDPARKPKLFLPEAGHLPLDPEIRPILRGVMDDIKRREQLGRLGGGVAVRG